MNPETVVLIATLCAVIYYTRETALLRRIEQGRLAHEHERLRASLDPEFVVEGAAQKKSEGPDGTTFQVTLRNTGGPFYDVRISSEDGHVEIADPRNEKWLTNYPGDVSIRLDKAGSKLTRFDFTLEFENELSEQRRKRFTYSATPGGEPTILSWTPRRGAGTPMTIS